MIIETNITAMDLMITKYIGKRKYHFTAKGANLHEVVEEVNKLSFPDNITKCGCCGSDDLELQTRTAMKKHKYVFVKCWSCKAELNFGHKQEDPNVFYLTKNQDGSYAWNRLTK